jgi:hypothetical protein
MPYAKAQATQYFVKTENRIALTVNCTDLILVMASGQKEKFGK